MSRLNAELARLYLLDPTQPDATELVDGQGRTRALVLELAAPADWAPLQAVWQGVQADLGLPAPAIAVSGSDGLQLWFSAPVPVAAADAQQWLRALCGRYLRDMAPHRLRLYPALQAGGAAEAVRHAGPVPAVQADGEKWSAFVAPDLVPLFTDTPWLDIEPSEEGQAALLGRVGVMKAGWFDAVLAGAGEGGDADAVQTLPAARSGDGAAVAQARDEHTGVRGEAVAFLRRVMNDEGAPLAMRVEAAKALLQGRG